MQRAERVVSTVQMRRWSTVATDDTDPSTLFDDVLIGLLGLLVPIVECTKKSSLDTAHPRGIRDGLIGLDIDDGMDLVGRMHAVAVLIITWGFATLGGGSIVTKDRAVQKVTTTATGPFSRRLGVQCLCRFLLHPCGFDRRTVNGQSLCSEGRRHLGHQTGLIGTHDIDGRVLAPIATGRQGPNHRGLDEGKRVTPDQGGCLAGG